MYDLKGSQFAQVYTTSDKLSAVMSSMNLSVLEPCCLGTEDTAEYNADCFRHDLWNRCPKLVWVTITESTRPDVMNDLCWTVKGWQDPSPVAKSLPT